MRENFEDTAELQAVLTNARGTPGPQSAWEHGMERRVAASETMIAEIHAMVQALRPVPTLLRPEPAVASVSAAFGSAAQMAAASGSGPVQGPSFCQGNARATPWPTSDTVPRTELFSSLPEPTRAMIDSCTSASLPLDARIPDGLRANIWADDYIDLAIMLKPTLLQHQEYSQAMYGGMAHPQGGMSQRATVGKAALAITSYERWLQAFNLYMSVYLLLPANVPLAVKMLKYAEIIRGLAEEGGDWRSYDEAFRSLRFLRGWAWDSIKWELWLRASQSVRRVGSPIPTGTPFPDKGRARSSYVGSCFSYNRGEQCDRATCYFASLAVGVAIPRCAAIKPWVNVPCPVAHLLQPHHPAPKPQSAQLHHVDQALLVDSPPPAVPLLGPGSNSPSPVCPMILQDKLTGYDSELRNYLVRWFTYGFTIGCLDLPVHFDINMCNLKSADDYAYIIDKKVANELLLGRVLGPYDVPPTCINYRISPLGVVPKKNPGEFRMIHHLYFPDGSSVNDFIPKEISSVQNATIQDAIDVIKDSPKPVYMAKVDVESAFRIIPISPADRPLLGFRWRGQYFMDAELGSDSNGSCH